MQKHNIREENICARVAGQIDMSDCGVSYRRLHLLHKLRTWMLNLGKGKSMHYQVIHTRKTLGLIHHLPPPVKCVLCIRLLCMDIVAIERCDAQCLLGTDRLGSDCPLCS